MANEEKEKKPITLDGLAEKVDSGFAKVEKRFAKVDQGFAKVDRQFEEMARIVKAGFDNTATKQDFQVLNEKIDKLDERVQTVETKLDRALYTEVVHLERRLRRVEEKVGIKPQTAS